MTLPGGTVTFLFSDIEGSTRLLEQLGDRYGDVHREHRRILREELTEAGGREVDTQGDAFFFSFERARDAVSGAVAAQRELATHSWPDGVEVKVRMGLHTGEPTRRRGGLPRDGRRPRRPHLLGRPRRADPALRDDAGAGREQHPGGNRRPRSRRGESEGHPARADLRALAVRAGRRRFPPLKTAPATTSADDLAAEIERRVHEQVLAGFEPGSPDESTDKLVKLVLVGFLALFLSLAALAAIFLLVRAVI